MEWININEKDLTTLPKKSGKYLIETISNPIYVGNGITINGNLKRLDAFFNGNHFIVERQIPKKWLKE